MPTYPVPTYFMLIYPILTCPSYPTPTYAIHAYPIPVSCSFLSAYLSSLGVFVFQPSYFQSVFHSGLPIFHQKKSDPVRTHISHILLHLYSAKNHFNSHFTLISSVSSFFTGH